MKRLIAVVVAVVMIVGAVLLRDRIDGDDGGGGGGGGGRSGDRIRLVCDTTLREVCELLERGNDEIEVVVRSSGEVADELTEDGAELDADAWLTSAPWPEIVADNREFDGLDGEILGASSEVLARSPAEIAVRTQSVDALRDVCGPVITWRCVGDQVPNGQRVGLAAPETIAGLTSLAAATNSWFDANDYSSVDFEDPAFGRWFDDLTSLSAATNFGRQTPLERALSRAGEFTTVGSLRSETYLLTTGARNYDVGLAEPAVTADVVLAPRTGLDAAELLDELGGSDLTDTLMALGWQVDGVTADGIPVELPDSSNMPSAGVLQTLRDRW